MLERRSGDDSSLPNLTCIFSHGQFQLAAVSERAGTGRRRLMKQPQSSTCAVSVEHYPAISTHPEVRACHWGMSCPPRIPGGLAEHPDAPDIREPYQSSEGLLLCSNWPFGADPTGPLGSSQSVGHGWSHMLLTVSCWGKPAGGAWSKRSLSWAEWGCCSQTHIHRFIILDCGKW